MVNGEIIGNKMNKTLLLREKRTSMLQHSLVVRYTSIKRNLINWFFPVMIIVYFLIMFDVNINTYIGLPIIFLITISGIVKMIKCEDSISSLVCIWIIYNILSVYNYAFNELPIECYTIKLKQMIFPILFFFFGKDARINDNHFYYSFLLSMLFCLGVGLVLYITTPQFYLEYLLDVRDAVWHSSSSGINEDSIMNYTRFSSFFGSSYAVSYFSIPSMCLSGYFIQREKKKSTCHTIFLYLLFLISFVSAILCQQRIAMVFSTIVLLFFVVFSKNSRKYFLIIITIFIIGLIYARLFVITDDRFTLLFTQLDRRLEAFNFSEAMGDRSNQYVNALSRWKNLILGDGLGSVSDYALKYGVLGVSDGEYVRIIVESGLVGLLIFVYIALSSLYKSVVLYKRRPAECLIILFFIIAGIGSNAFSVMYLFTPIFWFAVGKIQSMSLKHHLKNEY